MGSSLTTVVQPPAATLGTGPGVQPRQPASQPAGGRAGGAARARRGAAPCWGPGPWEKSGASARIAEELNEGGVLSVLDLVLLASAGARGLSVSLRSSRIYRRRNTPPAGRTCRWNRRSPPPEWPMAVRPCRW